MFGETSSKLHALQPSQSFMNMQVLTTLNRASFVMHRPSACLCWATMPKWISPKCWPPPGQSRACVLPQLTPFLAPTPWWGSAQMTHPSQSQSALMATPSTAPQGWQTILLCQSQPASLSNQVRRSLNYSLETNWVLASASQRLKG